MSAADEAADMMCCASCGISAIDDVKLKDCDGGCDLVKYCSVECQENHKDNHGEECKKQKAELRDRKIFTQPDESQDGDCPICCIPMPLDPSKCTFMGCCSNLICRGCEYANKKREYEAGLDPRCAFCREPAPKSQEEHDKNTMKRIKKNCPVALCQLGKERAQEGDYEAALQYLTKAAELGNAVAHYVLSVMYDKGQGVEKDAEKEMYHLEEAAIGGHAFARHNLGCEECNNNGNFERAKKHFIIATNLGDDKSLKALRTLYANGHASKEDYADALRAYQAAVDATKSAERKVAEAHFAQNRG